jgi:hypothetical protein
MRALDLQAITQRYGCLEGYASARLVTLGDGAERGMRVLELRSGGGLEAEIAIDRSFDIGRLALHGVTVSWHSAAGNRHPAHIDRFAEGGQGWLTGMSGFLGTCGFDHIRQPERELAQHLPLHPTAEIDYPLHGGGAMQPARLIGYGIDEDAAEPFIWCEGEVIQSMVFRGALRLRRRIELPLGGSTLTLRDTVTNIGPTTLPSMMLYHFNLGYPLVDESSLLDLGAASNLWANHTQDPCQPYGPTPRHPVSEISVHQQHNSDGLARCRLANPKNGLGVEIAYGTATLPYLQLLRVRGAGYSLIGIEPCSTAKRSRAEAREADEMPLLAPGESRRFAIDISAFSETFEREATS